MAGMRAQKTCLGLFAGMVLEAAALAALAGIMMKLLTLA